MKKLLFLFSLVLLCACNTKSDGSDTTNIDEDETPFVYIKEFTYKNHSYIYFKNGYTGGVVHDPECKYCLDKYD